jgi:hypothetical protein
MGVGGIATAALAAGLLRVAVGTIAGAESGSMVVGTEVVGTEVVGTEVVGVEVAGVEVAGVEVAGVEVAGVEVAGDVAVVHASPVQKSAPPHGGARASPRVYLSVKRPSGADRGRRNPRGRRAPGPVPRWRARLAAAAGLGSSAARSYRNTPESSASRASWSRATLLVYLVSPALRTCNGVRPAR